MSETEKKNKFPKMKKMISKGYTLEVVSWENDGDYYCTKLITVDTKKCAEAIYKLCTKLFKSINDKNPGIGNSSTLFEARPILKSWVKNNSELVLLINREYCDDDSKELDFDQSVSLVLEVAFDLMGFSEICLCRVCESCTVFYSEVDLFAQEINFEQP